MGRLVPEGSLRFQMGVCVRNSKSQLRTFGESLTTPFPYLLRSRTLLIFIAPLFARAFLQVGCQVGLIRKMKRHGPTGTLCSQLMFVLCLS